MPEDEMKALLEANLKLAKENNKMLAKMRRAQRNAAILRVAYWLVVLAFLAGAFIYIRPLIQTLASFLPGAEEAINNLIELGGFQNLVDNPR